MKPISKHWQRISIYVDELKVFFFKILEHKFAISVTEIGYTGNLDTYVSNIGYQ